MATVLFFYVLFGVFYPKDEELQLVSYQASRLVTTKDMTGLYITDISIGEVREPTAVSTFLKKTNRRVRCFHQPKKVIGLFFFV